MIRRAPILRADLIATATDIMAARRRTEDALSNTAAVIADQAAMPVAGQDGLRPVGLLRGLLILLMMLMVVVTATSSMAAEYDPAKCPDAQATVAALAAVGNQSVPPAIENGDPRGAIVCTVCCQPTHGFTGQVPASEESVSSYPPYRLLPDAGLLASPTYALLRPPRR
jgi:hypothetical protein